MDKQLVRVRVGEGLRALARAASVRIGAGVPASSRTPRVSLPGVLSIALVTLLLTLTAASTVTALRLHAGMQTEVSNGIDRIRAALHGLELEMAAVEQSLTGSCDQIRPSLVRASIDSALSRQILFVFPEDGTLCGPLAGRADSAIAAAVDRYLERVATQMSGTTLSFESMPTIQPGLLALAAGTSGGLLISQIDLKRVSNLIGVYRADPGRTIQLNLAQGGNYRLSSGADRVVLMPGISSSMVLISVREHDPVLPLELIANLTVYGFAMEMWPLLFPTFALAAALAALLISRFNTRLAHRSSPETRLRRAVRRRQFEPVVQPIVDAQTGRCLGGEVLMRWDHPVRGLVPPIEFIDQAEQTGLIVPMTEILMRKARDRLATALKEFPDLYFSVQRRRLVARRPAVP